MANYGIDIASPPDREKLVAQIIFDDVQWGEPSQEHDFLEVEFYPRPDGESWRIKYEAVVAALDEARRRLMGE